MNISSRYCTHALTTILSWILCSFVRIQFKMADLLPFLFAQIDKLFENVVCPDEYLQHQWNFFPILYTCIYYNPPMNPLKCCQDQNYKWPTYRYLCLLKLTIFLSTIIPWILWSFVMIKFKIVNFSSFLFAQIDKIFENCVRPDEYLQHQWIFVSNNLHMHLLQPPMNPYNLQQSFTRWGYHCVSNILVLYKTKAVPRNKYRNWNNTCCISI